MKITKVFGPFLLLCFCYGCGISERINTIEDPTERGLVYVALAIIFAAFIRGIFNK